MAFGDKKAYTTLILLLSIRILQNFAGATVYTVGDDEKWDVGVNYLRWSQKYNFTVGDALLFQYIPGEHNVKQVIFETFQTCVVRTGVLQTMNSGNDTFNLTHAGDYWFLCSVRGHCKGGMRLSINVSSSSTSRSTPQTSPSSPPQPVPPGNGAAAVEKNMKWWWGLFWAGVWVCIG